MFSNSQLADPNSSLWRRNRIISVIVQNFKKIEKSLITINVFIIIENLK